MGRIVILPTGQRRRAAYMESIDLPTYYMGDYSVLGLLVAPYGEAVRTLNEQGYAVRENPCGADVDVEGYQQVSRIRKLLHARGIEAEIADVVDAVYQA
mgnify:FL=1